MYMQPRRFPHSWIYNFSTSEDFLQKFNLNTKPLNLFQLSINFHNIKITRSVYIKIHWRILQHIVVVYNRDYVYGMLLNQFEQQTTFWHFAVYID